MYPVNEQVKEAWFNEIIFLQIGPHQTQILGLYFYLLLFSPLFLWLLNTGRGPACWRCRLSFMATTRSAACR